MSLLLSPMAKNSSAGFYNGVATQSLRFDRASDPFLNRTATLGNRKTWTFSTWLKRSGFTSAVQYIFGTNLNNNDATSANIHIGSDNMITVAPWANYFVKTNAVLRDVGAWYHIVVDFDTTQAGSGNSSRVNIYINGVDQPLTNGGANLGEDTEWAINLNQANTRIGDLYGDANELDGYLAETNFVDGLSLDASYFGETKNGVWIPKKPVVSDYGTNGFRLKFNANGLNTSSGTVSSPTNIGDDSSGKNNHFSVSNGIVASDCNMPDSPENNWCTINSIRESTVVNGSVALSEGNLRSVDAGTTYGLHWTSTFEMSSGKWYWEVLAITLGSNHANIGVCNAIQRGSVTGTGVFYGNDGKRNPAPYNSDTTSYGASYTDGDIIGVAFDADNETVTFYKNNASQGAVGSVLTKANGGYFAGVGDAQNSTTYKYHVNFGQDGSFAGELTGDAIGDKKDGNGNGLFKYAPPSGYLSLCSNNLEEPNIGANSGIAEQADDYFNTHIYNGNNNATRTFDIGFVSDWAWFKADADGYGHQLYDSSRGVQKYLRSNGSGTDTVAGDVANSEGVIDFNDSGLLKIGTDPFLNESGTDGVIWNWKAGGTTPKKTYKVKVVSDSTDYGHGTGSNKYQFFKSDGTTGFGTNGVDLDLQEGGTYTFDWSHSSAQSHPFRFSLTNDGTHDSGTSAGSEYTTGVVKDDSAYTTTITVASGVANLYYYCQSHSGMGAEVRTNATHGQTNFNGSILSVEQSNTTSGFSIVTYTGTGSNATVGHGINAPEVLLVKSRETSTYWMVYHIGLGSNTSYLSLNTTLAVDTGGASAWDSTPPTDSVFSIGTSSFVNPSSDMVAYCFHSVEGYSKFGSYTGNATSTPADGTFVFLGFKPSWVMLKRKDISGQWRIYDNKRSPLNYMDELLSADSSDGESEGSTSRLDFLSNGFKLRGSASGTNKNGGTYVYMAFGSSYKYANAR